MEIKSFRILLRSGNCRWKGQEPFIKFFILYLLNNEMPGDDPRYSHFVFIDHYIHRIILDAAAAFRTSEESYAVELRRQYEERTGYSVPDLDSFSLETSSFIQTCMQFVCQDIFRARGEYASQAIDELCNSHYHCLDKAFRKFIRDELIPAVNARYRKGRYWGYKGGFYWGTVSGYDYLTTERYRHNRNLHFKSNIFEFSVMGEFYFTKERPGHVYRYKKLKVFLVKELEQFLLWLF